MVLALACSLCWAGYAIAVPEPVATEGEGTSPPAVVPTDCGFEQEPPRGDLIY